MATKNNIQLIGNLGQDAAFVETDAGHKILNFSVATSDNYTGSNGERVESTDWHTCVVFGRYAEALKGKLIKGNQVFVEGKMKYRTYLGKDQVERRAAEIVVSSVAVFTTEIKEK